MKKVVLIIVLATCTTLAFADVPGKEKAVQIFKESFPEITNAVWSDHETGYQVYFEKANIKCRMFYDKQGRIERTIRYYGEENLSHYVKATVAKRFPDKKIFVVTEVSSNEGNFYVLALEDKNTWTHVRWEASEGLTVLDKSKKI